MSLPPEILQQRYGAIELAYSERRWAEVETLSQALLAELPPDPADPLQLRLVLLLGHTRLYGMADPPGARLYYNSVLEHCQEPTLREIAQQGLQHCSQHGRPAPGSQAAAPWLDGGDDPSQPSAQPGHALDSARGNSHATPWLTGEPDQAPAPVASAADRQADQQPGAGGSLAVGPLAAGAWRGDAPAAPQGATATETGLWSDPAENGSQPRRAGVEPTTSSVLVPEIVDEPEQIVVAQANPRLRQELPLEELAQAVAFSAPGTQNPAELTAEQLDDLSGGLLRVKVP